MLTGLLLFSCSTTKTTTSGQPVDVSEKLVVIPDGKAVVYIVRSTIFGLIIPFTVKIDGEEIGTTQGGKYIYAFVVPGEHSITSQAENKAEIMVTAEAGNTYYIDQEVRMGLVMARNELHLIDEENGKKKLSKCSLPDSFKKPE